jgi:hypothetical protein
MDSLLCKNIIVELVTTIVPPVLKLENAPLVKLDISNMQLLNNVENVLIIKEIVNNVKLIIQLDVRIVQLNIN